MQVLDPPGAKDDDIRVTFLGGQYEELLSDFRKRMDIALKMLRDYEEAARRGELS